MSIKKREDGKWLVNVKAGGRTGHQIKRVFKTQGEAKQFEIWAKSNHQNDAEWRPSKPDGRRLSDLIDLWHSHHGATLASSKDTYSRLKAMCLAMGDPVAKNFEAGDFAEYRANRLKSGLTPNTLNREQAYLRSVFNELIRLGHWTEDNPLKRVRQFKIQENELTYLTLDEIGKLLTALDDGRNVHALLISKVCLSTGSRWSESEGLRITQVRNGQIQFSETKSKKTRAVPIDIELEKSIQEHFKKHGTERHVFGEAYAAFRKGIERSGIQLPKGQMSHVLRHTFASHFMMNGGNILTLQKILGHSSLTMTMRYAHLAPDHLQEAKRLNPLSLLGSKKS